MALGRRTAKQTPLFVSSGAMATSPGHPFYEKLNRVLREAVFDRWVEDRCAAHYSDGAGRPSIPPGVYFRTLLIGYFEGSGEDRAIAWRCADSLGLRTFLGFGLDEVPPNHSSLSRIRDQLAVEMHREAFSFVLKMLESRGLLKGRKLAGIEVKASSTVTAGVVLYDGETSAGFGDNLYAVPIRALWEKTAGTLANSPTPISTGRCRGIRFSEATRPPAPPRGRSGLA